MTLRDPQINFRLPTELKEKLHTIASKNKRSVNAEMVAAIELVVANYEESQYQEFTAESARKAVASVRQNLLEAGKKYAQKEIAEAIRIGLNELILDIKAVAGIPDEHELDEKHDAQIFAEYIYPLIEYLTVLGFSVEFDGEMLKVAF